MINQFDLEARLKHLAHRGAHQAETDSPDHLADAARALGAGIPRIGALRMMMPLALILAVLLALAACGSEPAANSSSSGEVDRSDVEEVAVAMITAFLKSDLDTVQELVLPDQREAIATFRQVAELSPSWDVQIVDVTATVIEEDGTTAIVDYSGEYCLPETTKEVHVTTLDSDREEPETIPRSSFVVTEPEQCFELDDIFQTDHVEFELIDGEWYAPLPE